jgi:hypothetical protein
MLTYQGVRCAGGHGKDHSADHGDAHGHGHAEQKHQIDESQRLNTMFKIPTQEDIDYQLPKKGIFNERVS